MPKSESTRGVRVCYSSHRLFIPNPPWSLFSFPILSSMRHAAATRREGTPASHPV
jgi:hypothetical protein